MHGYKSSLWSDSIINHCYKPSLCRGQPQTTVINHKERRRFLHVARISGFMYKLDLMTFVLRIFFRHFLLTHTLDIIILDINIYFGH